MLKESLRRRYLWTAVLRAWFKWPICVHTPLEDILRIMRLICSTESPTDLTKPTRKWSASVITLAQKIAPAKCVLHTEGSNGRVKQSCPHPAHSFKNFGVIATSFRLRVA